jgi:hypothetical protein
MDWLGLNWFTRVSGKNPHGTTVSAGASGILAGT